MTPFSTSKVAIKKFIYGFIGYGIAYGILCLITWVLIIFNVIKYNGETPFGGMAAFASDSSDNIYVHSGIYGRVLVYDSNGNYLRNWRTLENGSMEMEVTKEQNVLVTEAKSRTQILYDRFGKELSRNAIDDNYFQVHQNGSDMKIKGKEYYAMKFLPYSIIYETSPIRRIVVQEKWYLTILSMGVGFACVFVGICLKLRLRNWFAN